MGKKMHSVPIKAVFIGGSAGSIGALQTLLGGIGPDFPLPILCVIHIPPRQPNLLPSVFSLRVPIPVKEAEDKELIQAGTLYFAPPDYHLLIEKDGTLSLSSDDPEHYSRPSIDALFESASLAYGKSALGILLTGANVDGAEGLGKIAARNGTTWVQDPATAEVATMPAAAIRLFQPDLVSNLPELGKRLAGLASQGVSSQNGDHFS
jgi:two-component system chemotaxis response regulator CheB